jgi:cytosine/adenosine deaminase-related metal-dependent hydrolase
MIHTGVRLALGTDSLSSNETLSVWSEMATLARAFPDLSTEHWIRAATIGGACALGLRPDELGWLAVDTTGDDPHAALVSAEPTEVRWLWRP